MDVELRSAPTSKKSHQPIPMRKYSPGAEREGATDYNAIVQGVPTLVFSRKYDGTHMCRQQRKPLSDQGTCNTERLDAHPEQDGLDHRSHGDDDEKATGVAVR